MEVLVLPIFISVVLVMAALVFFVYGIHNKDMEYQDQTSLLPLEEDE